MQWQRVLHGFAGVIENAGRVHSVYEFTLKDLPGKLVRVRVIETPEGQFYAFPNCFVENLDVSVSSDFASSENPERALQEALNRFISQVRSVDKPRLGKRQNW